MNRPGHCTVSIAILDVGQSRRMLMQMYWKLFNGFQLLYNSAVKHPILTDKGIDKEILS